MILPILAHKATLPIAFTASTIGVGGGLAIYHKDSIVKLFSTSSKDVDPLASNTSRRDKKDKVKEVSEWVYILSKGTTTSGNIDATLSDASGSKNFYCEFTDSSNQKSQDNDCLIYKADSSSTPKTIDFNSLVKLTDKDDLGSGKYQILRLSNQLYTKLIASSTKSLKVIQKQTPNSSPEKANTLDFKFLLSEQKTLSLDNSSVSKFVGRSKNKPTTVTPTNLTDASNYICKFSDQSKEFDCKLYKFATKTHKNDSLTFDGLTKTITVATDIDNDHYYVVDLLTEKHDFDLIKNKTVTVFHKPATGSNEKIFDLDFHQPLFGDWTTNTTETFIPKANEVSFMVQKVTVPNPTFTEANSSTKNYTCKFSKPSDSSTLIDNYDDSCTLYSLADLTTDKKIYQPSDLSGSTTQATKEKITGDFFFKLVFDLNKLHNIDFDPSYSGYENITLIPNTSPTSSQTIHFSLEHQINSTNNLLGKTDIVVAKYAGYSETDPLVPRDTKCSFNQNMSESFTCLIHKQTTPSNSDISKLIFNPESLTDTSSKLNASEYVALKLPKDVDTSIFKDKEKIYFKSTKPHTSNSDTLTFTIENFLGGSLESTKPLYLINTPSSP